MYVVLMSLSIGCQAGKKTEVPAEQAVTPVVNPTASETGETVVELAKEEPAAEQPAPQTSEERLAGGEACIQGRQAEAVAADLIEQQCTDSCTGNPSLVAPKLEAPTSDTPVQQEAEGQEPEKQ